MSDIQLYNMDDVRALAAEKDPRVTFTGEVWLDHKRGNDYLCYEEYQGKNIIPTEGLKAILDSAFAAGGASQLTTFYVGIFKANYTPIATNTAANSLGVGGFFTECQDADYDSPATNRPAWTIVAATSATPSVLTNTASKAEFTMAASITVYGAFIATSQAKTATTGKLIAAKQFTSSRAVVDNDILYVTYQLSASSA